MQNFYQHFPFLNRKNYKYNSILYILINAFVKFIENISYCNLGRLQNWLYSLADLLPVIHEAYHHHGDQEWTPTESQQALIRRWNEVNKTISIRTLRGINFQRDFSCGIEFPRSGISTYVYFDDISRRIRGRSNYPVVR